MSTGTKLSIGVISYRFDAMLDRTVRSLGFLPAPVEVIVQVAKGTGSDLQQFKLKYESMLEQSLIRVLHIGDRGIFNAMNRVRLTATGDYLWFINAGDELFVDFTLDRLLSYLTAPGSYGFRSIQVHEKDGFIRPAARVENPHPRQIAHPGAVYYRSAYNVIAFDESRSISSDLDFTEQSFNLSDWQYIPQIISVFQLDGVSSRYRFKDFRTYSNESLSLRVKFLIKSMLKLLVGPRWLHRILLFRKCDHVDFQREFPMYRQTNDGMEIERQ